MPEKQNNPVIKSYSFALCFESSSDGQPTGFVDPVTTINLALINIGNATWKTWIDCSHPGSRDYKNEDVGPGITLPVQMIDDVLYSVAFSAEPNRDIREAIRATIIGVPQPNGTELSPSA